MTSSLDAIGPDEKKKLEEFLEKGLHIAQEIADLREDLKGYAKALAEEFGVKPAILMKSVRTAFKSSLEDEKTTQDTVEDILTITGHA